MAGSSVIAFIAVQLIFLGSQVKSDAVDHCYSRGDIVPIYASKAISLANTSESYDYYDLPVCSRDPKLHVDKTLEESYLVLTPYKIEFLVDKQFEVLCEKTLSKTDVSKFRSAIKKDCSIEFYHDKLQILAPVGRVDMDHRDKNIKTEYFLYNHFGFDLYYHNGTIVDGLVQVDSRYMVNVTEEMENDVEFTYSVRWFATRYDERMEMYTTYSSLPPENNVFRYSIANSSFTILILIICLLVLYARVLRKDISKYGSDVEEAEMAGNQEETGWKSIHGDVFRYPKHKSLFAAALGSGTQLLVLTVAIFVLGVMDVFQRFPGEFVNGLAIVYAFTSVVSGYISTSFYHQLEGTELVKSVLLTGGLYVGPLFLTFVVSNTIAVYNKSTLALTLGETIKLFLLWIFLALPFLILGAEIGKSSEFDFQTPCRTAKCPKEVPKLRWYRGVLPQMVLAGFLPFGVIIIQISHILPAVWGYHVYTYYDSMLIMLFLLLITTALVSVVMTYFQLAAEDHEWWWRSFLCGGSTGLYVYGYSIYYYSYLTEMKSFTQTIFYFGYMACVGYGVFLALGTVGFYASMLFVRYLYASIKCD